MDPIEDHIPNAELAKNIDEIVIKKGKRPLHGTKLFVSMATNLSLGESPSKPPLVFPEYVLPVF